MPRALIIGGGIAGTVTAIALKKAGFEPYVYEAHGRTADGVGAFLTLAVNGMDALEALDLKEVITTDGFDTPRVAFYNGNGRQLGAFPLGGKLSDGTCGQTVLRSDLYVALRKEAERLNVHIEYGKRLTAAEQTDNGILANFADGTRAGGDLLIGADGLRSRVRQIIDPLAPRATYQGLLNTAGTARDVNIEGPVGTMNMIFGKRCFFCYIKHPNGDVWWFANPVHSIEPSSAELAELAGDKFKAELRRLFEVDKTPAAEIIEASSDIFPPFGTFYFPNVPVWHRNRMIIIGDAAHATSPAAGQGAAQALEDAVTLAKCLRDSSDIRQAFTGYEGLRRARVESIVEQGKRNGSNKQPGVIDRLFRDFFIAKGFKKAEASGDDPQRWMWDHHIDWDSRVAV